MAENTGIAWATHTHNEWEGCTRVGPGCDHCYAEARNQRFHAGANWGPGAPRRLTSIQNRNRPLRWQRERRAAIDAGLSPPRIQVFGGSLMDPFDKEAPVGGREGLWRTIERCPDLDWIMVTKRVGNVWKMAPPDGFWPHVIILATIVNQLEAERDLFKLRALKHDGFVDQIGVSYEPALGPIDWSPWIGDLDWLIVGGESAQGGAKARRFDVAWARSSVEQCRVAGVPVFVKQLGSALVARDWPASPFPRDKAGADPDEWPVDLRIRELPRAWS